MNRPPTTLDLRERVAQRVEDRIANDPVRSIPVEGRRSARKAASLTQHDIADLIGVSDASVAHWESGRSHPSSAHAAKYAEILRLCSEFAVERALREQNGVGHE